MTYLPSQNHRRIEVPADSQEFPWGAMITDSEMRWHAEKGTGSPCAIAESGHNNQYDGEFECICHQG